MEDFDATQTRREHGVPASPRRRRWWLGLAGLLAIFIIALVALWRWLDSDAGLHYFLAELERRSDGHLTVRDARGSLLSGVHAGELTYDDGEKMVTARDVIFTWSPASLLDRRLHVNELRAAEIRVRLGTGGESRLPSSLALPFPLVIDRAAVSRLELHSGKAQWVITGIGFGYQGGPEMHRLSAITLAAEQGTLAGDLDLGARPPFAVRGSFLLQGTEVLHSPSADVAVGGTLDALDIKASGRLGDASLTASAALAPFDSVPLKALAVALQHLDLATLDATLPRTDLTLSIDGAPGVDSILAGNFRAANREPGAIDHQRLPLRSLNGDFALSEASVRLDKLFGTLPGGGRVEGAGTVQLAPATPGGAGSTWRLQLQAINLATIYSTLLPTRLAGTVEARLENATQHVVAALSQQDMALDFDASIAGTVVEVKRMHARAGGGELTGAGRFDWSGKRAFKVAATARRFDPSRFGPFTTASLDGTVDASGHLKPTLAAQGTVFLAPTSRLRGLPASGRISGAYGRDRVQGVTAELRIGSAALAANGDLGGAADRLRVNLAVPRLQDLTPIAADKLPAGLAGGLQLNGQLMGAFNGLGFDLTGHADRLQIGSNGARSAEFSASVAPGSGYGASELRTRALALDLRAVQVTWQEQIFDRVKANVAGTLAEHRATLAVIGDGIDVEASASGALAPAASFTPAGLAWSGTITQLENRGDYAVRLTTPARLEASRTHVALTDAHVRLPEGAFDIATLDWNQGRITSRGSFAGVPVAAFARFSRNDWPVRTTLVMAGDWNVVANPRLNGTINVRRERGDVFADASTVNAGELAFGLSELRATATFANDALDASAALRATRLGSVDAALSLGRVDAAPPGRIAPDAPLKGTVRAELASLKPLQPLLGTTALVDGMVRLDVAIAGTSSAPSASGTLAATRLTVDAPQYGLHWRDGILRARLENEVLHVDPFMVTGGDGRFVAQGSVPFAAFRRATNGQSSAHLDWHAEKFRATNRPDLRLVASGDGAVGFARGRIALKGALRIDEGNIEYERTPGATLGDDVVVIGRPRTVARVRTEDAPLDLDLEVDLGNRLTVAGSGLRTTLEGRARIATTPSGALTARGTLTTVRGTYAAFGQQLAIERGRFIFDGPIDNPTLDVVALRKNLAVEAGVEITGSARLPQIRLTSNPPLPEGEKLSWLVLGQGLERTSGTETAALQAAAATLFSRNGPSFGTSLAQSIGLDDLSVRGASGGGSGGSGGSGTGSGLDRQVVAFSKRLSDRLYVIFEAGLSAANNVLRIEYTLTKAVSLRAQAGTVSSLGIHFLRSFR
ncbi:MAG: translocation/assembly module TamB domain-containing protein [Betaproteobacteria bacterium]